MINRNIVLGENREFELTGRSNNYQNYFFKIKKFGEDFGKKITVRLYGGIAVPSGVSLTREERNRLHMKAIAEYKNCFKAFF